MYDVVWSINIMCAILMGLIAAFIVYIFKYDEWYPNERQDIGGSESGGTYSGASYEG